MQSDIKAACRLLEEQDDILILTHQKPDGDTYGSGFALLWALEALGKRARVECADGYLERFSFVFGEYAPAEFVPRFVVSVDIASPELLGSLREPWADKIDLCIDHHKANRMMAAHMLVQPNIPATCQIVHAVITCLGVPFDQRMATAIFTGISTDTGCFRFSNVVAETHRIAADMIDAGAAHDLVNTLMFETKSKGRLAIDRLMMDTLEYYLEGRCAVITIPDAAVEQAGITEAELDGISAFPRKIEGVLVGVTMREREGSYRVSVRTRGELDAAAICLKLGGGGHKNAAGCTVSGELAQAKKTVLQVVEEEMARLEEALL